MRHLLARRDEPQVRPHRERRVAREHLRQVADARGPPGVAARRPQQPEEQSHRGIRDRSVRAETPDELPGPDHERHVVEREPPSEPTGEADGLDQRLLVVAAAAAVVAPFDFFFNDTATTEIYTLSLHDALPI